MELNIKQVMKKAEADKLTVKNLIEYFYFFFLILSYCFPSKAVIPFEWLIVVGRAAIDRTVIDSLQNLLWEFGQPLDSTDVWEIWFSNRVSNYQNLKILIVEITDILK